MMSIPEQKRYVLNGVPVSREGTKEEYGLEKILTFNHPVRMRRSLINILDKLLVGI